MLLLLSMPPRRLHGQIYFNLVILIYHLGAAIEADLFGVSERH